MTTSEAREIIAKRTPIFNNEKNFYRSWGALQLHYYDSGMPTAYFLKCQDEAAELYASEMYRNLANISNSFSVNQVDGNTTDANKITMMESKARTSDEILEQRLSEIKIGETKSEFELRNVSITSDLGKEIISQVVAIYASQNGRGREAELIAYLNENCVDPTETGITQSEHFQEALKIMGIEFTDSKKGWQLFPYETQEK